MKTSVIVTADPCTDVAPAFTRACVRARAYAHITLSSPANVQARSPD
jgi:hypothetical protein